MYLLEVVFIDKPLFLDGHASFITEGLMKNWRYTLSPSWKNWTFGDVLLGVVLPCIFGIVLIAFSQVRLTLAFSTGIFTVVIPVIFGLIWNRWAGGCSGFLVGSREECGL